MDRMYIKGFLCEQVPLTKVPKNKLFFYIEEENGRAKAVAYIKDQKWGDDEWQCAFFEEYARTHTTLCNRDVFYRHTLVYLPTNNPYSGLEQIVFIDKNGEVRNTNEK